MTMRTPGNQKTDTDEVLRKGTRAGDSESAFSALETEVLPPAESPLLAASPSARQVMRMQQMVGNRAVQAMLKPAAAKPTTEPHAPNCTCPGCAAQMRTVIDDKPQAAPIQRESSGHDAGCSCPTCVGARTATAPTALIQRAEASTYTEEEDFESEQAEGMPDLGLTLQTGSNPDDRAAIEKEESVATAVPPGSGFTAGGMTGVAPVKVTYSEPEDGVPHAFTDGGMTGTVAWAGGGGAGPRGNQGTGSLQTETKPVYESGPDPADATKFVAWVKAGTGVINVTRSWLGAFAGDQGNGQYVTSGAMLRFNAHEVKHVNSTKSIYDANIAPMLAKVAAHYPGGTTVGGATAAAAVASLKSTIGWATAVTAFQTQDTAQNKPMGPIDTNDLASGTYPENRGPAKIAGKDYTNAVATPGEALPAP